jgi:hypothetical protein
MGKAQGFRKLSSLRQGKPPDCARLPLLIAARTSGLFLSMSFKENATCAKIARTGRVQDWLDSPEGRLAVAARFSC